MFNDDPKDWREILKKATNDKASKQRLVADLGVREITIDRWIKGEASPRPHNLQRLVHALPDHQKDLIRLFADNFDIIPDPAETIQEIPAKFYAQIFQRRTNITRSQRYWSLTQTILGQALSQLDPENLGMAITVVQCMKHSRHKNKIWSLRQSMGQGTSPWPNNLEQTALFLGAEFLAGYVISTCRPADVQDYEKDNFAPLGHQFPGERSAASSPILYAGKIAGCLLISSTSANYFQLPQRMQLITDYAQLIALAFDLDDFYYPSAIELRVMPAHQEQRLYFENFRQRLKQARHYLSQHAKEVDAEQFVWEELEEEILEKPPTIFV